MKNAVIYVHGKGGNAEEANHYKQFLMTALKSLDLITNPVSYTHLTLPTTSRV